MDALHEKHVVLQRATELYTNLDAFLDEQGIYTFARGQSNVWQFIESEADESVWGSEICWRVMKTNHCLAFFFAFPQHYPVYQTLREYAFHNALFYTVDIAADYIEGLINYICDTSYSRSSLNSPFQSLNFRQIRRIPHEWVVEYLKIEVYDFTRLSRAQQERHVLDVVRRKEFLLLNFKGNRGMFELLEANPACMVYMADHARRKIDYALYVLSRYEECKESFSTNFRNIMSVHFLGPMSEWAYARQMVHNVMTPLKSYDTFLCGFAPPQGAKRQKLERTSLPEEILRAIFQFAGYPATCRDEVAALQDELAIRNPNYAYGLSQLLL
jgi:hypothetical protein